MTHDHVDALMVGAGQPDSRSARELTAAGVAHVVLETGHEQGRFGWPGRARWRPLALAAREDGGQLRRPRPQAELVEQLVRTALGPAGAAYPG